jgi:BMFP domain-containing protein YqiC
MVYQQLLARANEEIALSARKLAAFQAKVQELEAKVPKPAELNQNKE